MIGTQEARDEKLELTTRHAMRGLAKEKLKGYMWSRSQRGFRALKSCGLLIPATIYIYIYAKKRNPARYGRRQPEKESGLFKGASSDDLLKSHTLLRSFGVSRPEAIKLGPSKILAKRREQQQR